MKIKYLLRYMLFMFSTIVTVQVIYITLISTIRGMNEVISYRDLQTIIITSFVGILPTPILYTAEKVSRKAYFLFILPLHFSLTLGFVFTTLYMRGNIISEDLTYPIILFLALYIGFHIRAEIRNKKAMDELNKRINATHQP